MNIEHIGDGYRFATYSRRMINDPAGIAEELRHSAAEQGIEFDTIVGRGSSGMLIVPLVATILGKKWFIVRKDEEVMSSHDSSCKWMGELGKRWVFLDDFCSSGQTFRKVRDGVREAVEVATAPYQTFDRPQNDPYGPYGWYTYQRPQLETELVGYFQYESRDADCNVLVPWDENATPGYNDMYWDDAPGILAEKARQEARREEQDRAKGERLQAEADARAEAAIEGSVYTTPIGYQSITAQCGPDCIVCQDVSAARGNDETTIEDFGSLTPVSTRYAMQVTFDPQSNVIVRNS